VVRNDTASSGQARAVRGWVEVYPLSDFDDRLGGTTIVRVRDGATVNVGWWGLVLPGILEAVLNEIGDTASAAEIGAEISARVEQHWDEVEAEADDRPVWLFRSG
jgi:hypothetical protein